MDGASPVSRPELFAWAVRKRHIPVESAKGLHVEHVQWGRGQILDVQPGQSSYHIQIHFAALPPGVAVKTFLSQVFRTGEIIDLELPPVLAANAALRTLVAAEVRAQNPAAPAPELTPQPAQSPTQDAIVAPDTRWVEFEARRKEEILAEQSQQAAIFDALVARYLQRAGVTSLPFDSRLDLVLRRLHAPRKLAPNEISSLDGILQNLGRRRPAIAATCYEVLAAHCGLRGYLARACRYWRLADHPERVLEIAEPREGDSPVLQAAFLNTRAAALADMENWAEAKQLSAHAASIMPDDSHAYNVLGRISRETGARDQATGFFAVAQRRAAPPPPDPDAVLRTRLAEMTPAARAPVARYLLAKDRERYHWVAQYLATDGGSASS